MIGVSHLQADDCTFISWLQQLEETLLPERQENRHFSSAFVPTWRFGPLSKALFWLKKRGLMPGLTFSNELISRDEGMEGLDNWTFWGGQ